MQEYVSGLSRGLRDIGAEVEIFSGGVGPPDGPPPNSLSDGLAIRWHPKQRLMGRYVYPSGLATSIREASRWADVLHVHQPFYIGTWMAAVTSVPTVATLYLHPEHVRGPRNWRRRQQLKFIVRRLDLVAAVSEAERELLRSVVKPRRDCVVWPAVEIGAPYDEELPDSDGGLVLAVGRLNSAKGIDRVLRAYSMVDDSVEVVVVGDGAQRAEFWHLCSELSMDPSAVLAGPIADSELDKLYRRASVFVSASTEESFGIAPLKAIANGCIPVLSDIPSHREIVVGLGLSEDCLVPVPVNPVRLAEKIRLALDSPPPDGAFAQYVPTWSTAAETIMTEYEAIVRRSER